jgi:hypothetical protein
MATIRKDAGAARERPKPPIAAAPRAGAPPPTARPAGAAPVFDAKTSKLTTVAGQHKGMISNPWVKYWTGAGPAPTARPATGAPGQPGTKAPAEPEAKAGPEKSPPRRAGPAPRTGPR